MVLTPILRSFDKLLFSKTISVVAIRVPRQLCHTVQYVCSSELFDIVELSFRIIYFEIHITRVFNWILHQMKIVLYYEGRYYGPIFIPTPRPLEDMDSTKLLTFVSDVSHLF